jgi:hypothetical protein
MKFFVADPDPGSSAFLALDSWIRGGKIQIRDKHIPDPEHWLVL